MKEQIKVMISGEKVNARICELAQQINEDYAGKELHLVIILHTQRTLYCDRGRRCS